MKRNFLSIITVIVVLFTSCAKDNFEAPGSLLTGRVVYQNLPVGVRSNGVQLELWQSGFQLFSKIPVFISQEGTFSARLFDGEYKLTRLKGNGPWLDNTDTIAVSVKGNTIIDVPIDPFFTVKNEKFVKSGTAINATFNLQRVNTTKPLELVRLYIGQTNITDQNNNAGNVQLLASAIPDPTQPVTLSANIPASLANKDFVFARVGVKTVGVAELLYSMPIKVMLK